MAMNPATEGDHGLMLRQAQFETLAQDRMASGLLAGVLFRTMDLLYGREASLAKFRVLEVIARVPYMAWEHVGYVAVTHTHATPNFAHAIHGALQGHRAQQDNELFHLLILEELLQRRGERQTLLRHRVLPQLIAWIYYHVSWLLFVVRPRWSYQLNAEFEDHAEHEYMAYVDAHPELEDEPWLSAFSEDYGAFDSVADLLRQIGLDERHHKLDSLASIEHARFGSRARA